MAQVNWIEEFSRCAVNQETEMPEGKWLQIDEASDVVMSLRHLRECLKLVGDDPSAWKWAIFAVHNALQGAMTCHVNGTANLGCLTKKSATEWLTWYREGRHGNQPSGRLATPPVLFERLHNADKRPEPNGGEVLSLTADHKLAFELVNGLRNKFVHFTPKTWLLEYSGLPSAFLSILAVIGMIRSEERRVGKEC